MSEYQTFVRVFTDLTPGEHVLFIKDIAPGPRKYDTRLVRAQVSDRPEANPGWDRLWVRSEAGRKLTQPWAIRVVAEMGEVVAGKPYQDVFTITQRLTKELR